MRYHGLHKKAKTIIYDNNYIILRMMILIIILIKTKMNIENQRIRIISEY